MVSDNVVLSSVSLENDSGTACSNSFVSQAGLATKMSTTPGIMTTPVSPALFSDEVIAYGGIKSQEAKGIRSSGRLRAQPNADATQLEKAMLLAQRRNESFAQGISQPHSLLNFSDEQIIHNATVLGVSMGSSFTAQINAAHIIKENEFQRTLTILKKNESVLDKSAEQLPCLIVSRASDLVGDLDDEDFLLDTDLPCASTVTNKIRCNRKKKSYDKTKVRRSNRIRNKKYS
jgi:hypothetical protein